MRRSGVNRLPIGPLLQQVMVRLSRNPQLQQKVQAASKQVASEAQKVLSGAKTAAQPIMAKMTAAASSLGVKTGGAASNSNNNASSSSSSSSGTGKASSGDSGRSSSQSSGSGSGSTGSSNTGSNSTWTPQMRFRAFAGRLTQSAKDAFKHFNLARDFMLVIMLLQLAQGLYHLATGKPQTHPHMKQAANAQKKAVEDGKANNDNKNGNQTKNERKKERDQQRQLQQKQHAHGADQVAPVQSSTGLAVGAALAGGAVLGTVAATATPHELANDSHPAYSPTSSSFASEQHDNEDRFSSSSATSLGQAPLTQVPSATGLAAPDEQPMTVFVFGDSNTNTNTPAASYDPLSRSSLFSWGGSKFSDLAAVSYHSDAGYSHVAERAYDPLRR